MGNTHVKGLQQDSELVGGWGWQGCGNQEKMAKMDRWLERVVSQDKNLREGGLVQSANVVRRVRDGIRGA